MKLAARLAPAFGWVLTRAVMLGLWALFEDVLNGDVRYYWDRMHRLVAGLMPASQTMVEYPTPVLWLLRVPYTFSGGTQDGFLTAFVVMLLLVDLVFTLLLWQRGRGKVAVWFWVFFGLAMGPLLYFRLDLVPSVLCALALLALRRSNSGAAGGWLAFGAGLKLWPALLWPTMLRGDRKQDLKLSGFFFAGGVLLVVAAVAYAGFDRLISPLKWQSLRGLQVESIWATPAMVARLFSDSYQTGLSQWQAFEIWGPGVETLLTLATLATDLGYLAILISFVVWILRLYPGLVRWRSGLKQSAVMPSFSEVGLFMVTVITVVLIANKTFSPQYLIWLAAPLAALLTIIAEENPPAELRKTAEIAGGGLLILAAATHVIYPMTYGYLLGPAAGAGPATAVLVLRNLLLVVFGGWLIARFVTVLRQPRAGVVEAPADSAGQS